MARRTVMSRGQTVTVAAERILSDQLALVLKRLRKVGREPGDAEAVHQLRVATRRARAALELFAPLLSPKVTNWFQKKLRKLRRAAGDARNLDVYRAHLAEQLIELPAAVAELLDEQRERAQRPLVKLDKRLRKGKRWQEQQVALLAELKSPKVTKTPPPSVAEFAAQALVPLAGEFRAGLMPSNRSAAQLHRLRIAGKRLRYTLEVVAGALPKRKLALLKPLEGLQQILGDLNDLSTAAELINGLVGKADKGAPRKWLKSERKRQRATFSLARLKFMRGWSQAERQKLTRLAERLLNKKKKARKKGKTRHAKRAKT
jgi:CHAD domain-containing protein